MEKSRATGPGLSGGKYSRFNRGIKAFKEGEMEKSRATGSGLSGGK